MSWKEEFDQAVIRFVEKQTGLEVSSLEGFDTRYDYGCDTCGYGEDWTVDINYKTTDGKYHTMYYDGSFPNLLKVLVND